MILYKSDWAKYPEAFPDTSTRNKSFLNMAILLRDMKIENHAFMLALHNRELIGVDPHSTTLTRSQKVAIAYECKINFWYFVREVVRVPSDGSMNGVEFGLNRARLAILWLCFAHIVTLAVLIRQVGKTNIMVVIVSYLFNIKVDNTRISLLTKDPILRKETLDKIRATDILLPPYLLARDLVHDTTSGETYTVHSKANVLTAKISNASPLIAGKVFQGATSSKIFVDELASIPNNRLALSAMLPTADAARITAKANNEPYFTMMFSNAGELNTRDGQYAYKIYTESSIFTERLYDAFDEPDLERTIRVNNPNGICRVVVDYNHRQMGYTDDWWRSNVESSMVSGDELKRFYLNIWTNGSEQHPLPPELLDKIVASKNDAFHSELIRPQNIILRWFIPLNTIHEVMSSGKFVLSCDPSEGTGRGDDLSIQIMALDTGFVVASANVSKEILIPTFAEWFAALMLRFPNTIALIEKRSSGQSIIDALLIILPQKGIDPFKRMFNWVVDEMLEKKDRFDEINIPLHQRKPELYERYKRFFGFATSAAGLTSRKDLYGSIVHAAKLIGSGVRDPITITQISSLVEVNGRIDHPSTGHDDLVISWLLGFWFMTKARNTYYYGIDRRYMLSAVIEVSDELNVERTRHVQNQLKDKLVNLLEHYRLEHSTVLKMRLARDIKTLATQIDNFEETALTVDDLLSNRANKIAIDKLRNSVQQQLR